jgi:hypothetical protein
MADSLQQSAVSNKQGRSVLRPRFFLSAAGSIALWISSHDEKLSKRIFDGQHFIRAKWPYHYSSIDISPKERS